MQVAPQTYMLTSATSGSVKLETVSNAPRNARLRAATAMPVAQQVPVAMHDFGGPAGQPGQLAPAPMPSQTMQMPLNGMVYFIAPPTLVFRQ